MIESLAIALERDCSPFDTSDYHQCWWEHLAPKFSISDREGSLLIHKKKVGKGLLSLRELRIAGWNNAWYQHIDDERAEHLKTYAQTVTWDYFRMRWNSTHEEYQAFHKLQKRGFQLLQIPSAPSYVVDISQGWDAYLKSKGHESRKDIRRKLNKVSPLNPELFLFTGNSGIEEFYRLFFKHHIPYWSEKTGYSYFSDPREQTFIINWAKSLEQSGHLILQGLRLGGDITNLSMGLRFGDTLYFMMTINTGCYSQYYPGIIMNYFRIEQAATLGVKKIDMGFGEYNYKNSVATHTEKCYELFIPNPKSLKGQLYRRWLQKRLANVPS